MFVFNISLTHSSPLGVLTSSLHLFISTFPDFYFPATSVTTSLIHQFTHLFPCSAHPKSHTGLLFLSVFNRCPLSCGKGSVCLCVATSCFRRRLVSGFQHTLSKTCHNSGLFDIGQEDYKPQRMCKASSAARAVHSVSDEKSTSYIDLIADLCKYFTHHLSICVNR